MEIKKLFGKIINSSLPSSVAYAIDEPVVTVEQIHTEFDSGEQRILDECDRILAELKIPTESQLERKAKLAQELGFHNSQVVSEAKVFADNRKQIEKTLFVTNEQASLIRYYKEQYPFEKFITIDELKRICEKYGLIHAPVVNYIKDIPEKNLLEIKNAKKRDKSHTPERVGRLKFELYDWSSNYEEYLSPRHVNGQKHFDIVTKVPDGDIRSWDMRQMAQDYFTDKGYPESRLVNFRGEAKLEIDDNQSLFVAAPPSHFNLKGLEQTSEYGYSVVKRIEVKDPVVFEYFKGNVVRIITKWGTDDDQSYLDPALQNEILN